MPEKKQEGHHVKQRKSNEAIMPDREKAIRPSCQTEKSKKVIMPNREREKNTGPHAK